MRLFILFLFLLVQNSFAEVGRVIKIAGPNDAYLIRANQKMNLAPELELELNDAIFSAGSYVVIHLYPGTQMSLSKDSEILLSEHKIEEVSDLEKAFSVIDFLKGLVRVQVTRDEKQEIEQIVRSGDVSFGVRGTEFELFIEENKDVDLDVLEGEVVVSSPHVHTFVPEIVKANEGFKYGHAKKTFGRRKFLARFKNHPGFVKKDLIRKKWKEMRQKRGKKGIRSEKKTGRRTKARNSR